MEQGRVGKTEKEEDTHAPTKTSEDGDGAQESVCGRWSESESGKRHGPQGLWPPYNASGCSQPRTVSLCAF